MNKNLNTMTEMLEEEREQAFFHAKCNFKNNFSSKKCEIQWIYHHLLHLEVNKW